MVTHQRIQNLLDRRLAIQPAPIPQASFDDIIARDYLAKLECDLAQARREVEQRDLVIGELCSELNLAHGELERKLEELAKRVETRRLAAPPSTAQASAPAPKKATLLKSKVKKHNTLPSARKPPDPKWDRLSRGQASVVVT